MSFKKVDILNYGSKGVHTVYYREDIPLKLALIHGETEQSIAQPSLEIFYVVKGKVEVSFEGKKHNLFSGDILLVNMHTFHHIRVLSGSELLIFKIQEEYLIQKFSEPVDFEPIWPRKNQFELRLVLVNIALHFLSAFDTNTAISTFLEKLTFLLDAHKRHQFYPSTNNDPIALVVERLSYNLYLNLQELANESFLSYSHLSREFTATTGENFALYSRKIKLNRAVWLLIESSSTIAHISQEVGFSNNQVFGRNFKAFFGVTPTEFRNQRIQSENDLNEDEKTLVQVLYREKEKTLDLEDNTEEHAFYRYALEDLDYEQRQSFWGEKVLFQDLLQYYQNLPQFREMVSELNIKQVSITYIYCLQENRFVPDLGDIDYLSDTYIEMPLMLELLNNLGIDLNLGFQLPQDFLNIPGLSNYPNPVTIAFNEKLDCFARYFGLTSLRSWSYELHLDHYIREGIQKSEYLFGVINRFRQILVERLETPHINWGIHLGKCSYHDIQLNFFEFEKKLDCKPSFFTIQYQMKVKSLSVNFNYIEVLLNQLKRYSYQYFVEIDFKLEDKIDMNAVVGTYFGIGIISELFKSTVPISLLTYRIHLGDEVKHFRLYNEQGIETVGNYFLQFIKTLGTNYYYDEKSGMVVSKDQDDYTILIFSNAQAKLVYSPFDSEQENQKNIKYLLEGIDGRYKVSKQRIDFKKNMYYKAWLNNMRKDDLTIKEYDYVRQKIAPELEIRFIESNEPYLIDLDMNSIDFVLYKFKKI